MDALPARRGSHHKPYREQPEIQGRPSQGLKNVSGIHRDRYVGSLFVANQWYLSVCHEVHIYIKGWLPSILDVAVTANEMREGLSVSVCRHWHQTLCKPIICLWHCGMRHRGGSTVFCERVRVKLPRSTRPMIHYSNRAHRRSLVVGSLKNYCRKVLHI